MRTLLLPWFLSKKKRCPPESTRTSTQIGSVACEPAVRLDHERLSPLTAQCATAVPRTRRVRTAASARLSAFKRSSSRILVIIRRACSSCARTKIVQKDLVHARAITKRYRHTPRSAWRFSRLSPCTISWHRHCNPMTSMPEEKPQAETSLHILIVDQNVMRASILEEGLREAGYRKVSVLRDMQNLMRKIVD